MSSSHPDPEEKPPASASREVKIALNCSVPVTFDLIVRVPRSLDGDEEVEVLSAELSDFQSFSPRVTDHKNPNPPDPTLPVQMSFSIASIKAGIEYWLAYDVLNNDKVKVAGIEWRPDRVTGSAASGTFTVRLDRTGA